MAVVQQHPNRAAGEQRERQRRASEIRRELQKSELAATEYRLTKVKRLLKPDPAILARNIGRIAEDRSTDQRSAKALLKKAFEDGLDPRWRKRLRWSRLAGEETIDEKFGSAGKDFLGLAMAIAEAAPTKGMTAVDNRDKAVFMLLAGTSFDPDVGGLAQIDVDSKRVIVERLTQIRASLLSAVPELPAYFGRISDHCLTHEVIAEAAGPHMAHLGRDEGKFLISGWGEHGGDAEGQLIPEALHDGCSLTEEEGFGLASTFPCVKLAEITLSRHVPLLAWGHLMDAMPDLSEGAWLDANAVAREVRARKLFPEVASKGPVEMPLTGPEALPVSKTWRVNLVAFPCGGRSANDIQLGIVVEDIDTTPARLDALGGTLDYQKLEFLDYYVGMWRDLENEAHSYCYLLDLSSVTVDATWSYVEEMVSSLWLATGDNAMRILTLKSSAFIHSGIETPLSVSTSVPAIVPLFEVPARYTETPLVSLAGMIDRNHLFSAGANRLGERLQIDAVRRVETLRRQLEVELSRGDHQ